MKYVFNFNKIDNMKKTKYNFVLYNKKTHKLPAVFFFYIL